MTELIASLFALASALAVLAESVRVRPGKTELVPADVAFAPGEIARARRVRPGRRADGPQQAIQAVCRPR